VLAFAFAVYPFLSQAHAEGKKAIAFIGVSNTVDQSFWIAMAEAVKSAAKKKNVEFFDMTPSSSDPLEQKKRLENVIDAKNVDGIILGANKADVLTEALDKAAAAGIPVVTIDTAVNHPAVKALIATDNLAGAKIAGEYIVKRTGGKGTVLILGGTEHHVNGDLRRKGVEEAVAAGGMKVIFRYADWKVEKGFMITEEELNKAGNDITAVFSCNDPMALAAKQVIVSKNAKDKITIVGFDGLQMFYKAIVDGKADATIAQPVSRMAEESVDVLMTVLDGKEVAKEDLIPSVLVDAANVAQFIR